jgi:hypothetical protein
MPVDEDFAPLLGGELFGSFVCGKRGLSAHHVGPVGPS